MPESYQPGPKRNYRNSGVYSENRYAWTQVLVGQVIILVGNEESPEPGSDVVLFIPRAGRRPDLSFNLTSLTEQELDALHDLFDAAFEWARPISRARDKRAEDANAAGDDSFTRNYRPIPQLVFRKRPSGEYSEGLRQRPSDISRGIWPGDNPTEPVRDGSDAVAESDQKSGGSQDNSSSPDDGS